MATRRKTKKKRFTHKMQIKLLAIFAFVLLALAIINIRISYIAKTSGDKYTKQVLSQQQYDSRTIPFRRGEIRDRNGTVLAKSEKVYNLVLDCYAVNQKEDYIEPTVRALVSTMGLDESEVRSRLTSDETKDSQYQVLKRQVTIEEKQAYEDYVSTDAEKKLTDEQIKERRNITGIWFEENYIREYPMSTVASTVVGFSNNLNDGVSGLEVWYSDVLNGVNGREFGYLNEDSELQRTIIEPTNGNTLVMSIDTNIQQVVEKYIAQYEAEHMDGPSDENAGHGAKNVGVIVADCNTGEILAMATNKGYDLNDPFDLTGWYSDTEVDKMSEEDHSKALNERWANFTVSEAFEPGSTMKPITVSYALDIGAITDDESYMCDGGEQITDRYIKCDNVWGHGMESLSDVIMNSCNDAIMQISMKVGIGNFLQCQAEFGFGLKTGIDLPNENAGILYTKNSMHEVELATNAFGQGFTCSMIQELAAFSTVVNGGYYYQPHVVRQVLDPSGGVAKTIDPVVLRNPISQRSSSLLREYLEKGVSEGTGRRARVPGYRVGGKTGTAEKLPRENGKYVVSFIGAVPINDPQVVCYVVIDEPNVEDQTQGGYPQIMFRQIMTEVLPYMNIYPTEEITDNLLSELGITQDEALAGGNAVQNETQETNEDGTPVEGAGSGDGVQGDPENPVAQQENLPGPPEANENAPVDDGAEGVTPDDLQLNE